MRRLKWITLIGMTFFVVSCSGGKMTKSEDLQKLSTTSTEFTLLSPAFKEGETIPKAFTCQGGKHTPPLRWFNAPKGTKSFVLILKDPDAPSGLWTHWVTYNIPATTDRVEEGSNPKGATLGQNEVNAQSYYPPCPPSGTHRYIFDLYALDVATILPKDRHRSGVEATIKGHVLGETKLTGKVTH